MTNEVLCTYRDEAIGANPIPLTVAGENLRVQKSSDYFTGLGIAVSLTLDKKKKIQQIQLGPDINVEAETLKRGVEVGPFGWLPVHVIQMDETFDLEKGGVLRFGFLKQIISFKSVGLLLKNIAAQIFSFESENLSKVVVDLSKFWKNYHGENSWGTYEILVKKNELGKWAIYSAGMPVNELVAKFKVNKAGMVLGITEMYSA